MEQDNTLNTSSVESPALYQDASGKGAKIFNGEDLSEAFKDKAEVIFEAAVNERLTLLEDELKVAVEESFETELETFKEELTERIDDYLNYVVEEWVKENEVAVEKGLRTEVAESFIGGLKTLFESNFIDIPDEKVDVLEEMIKENQKSLAKSLTI